MFATFLLVCFVCLKESTSETRRNTFYFTLKALLVLVIISFEHFRYSNIMMSSNVQARNMKHILLNNSGSKWSLVMKFDQFMPYCKIIFLSKNSTKNVAWKLVPGLFLIFKESSVKKIVWRSACWFGQILIDLLLHI